ncbi:MAG TPA: CRISPR-associated helicase Cas3' [Dermatophilaceae bacterium]|mgnify:CR=1 FL=1|nr:CRISPR-associated helicase Cas3' [Dermatophilaceae bacterium]
MTQTWSPAVLAAWGKTDATTGEFLRLHRHLEDAAAMAAALWDSWLPRSVKATISAGLPGGLEDGRRLYVFLAGVHDIGKMAPSFAAKVAKVPGMAWVQDRMVQADLPFPLDRGDGPPPPHCRVGQFILEEWFARVVAEAGGVPDRQIARQYAAPVGAHHGVPPSVVDLVNTKSRPHTVHHKGAWRAAQDELLHGMATAAGAIDRLPRWLTTPLPVTAQMQLSGAIVVADWLASDQARFPFTDLSTSAERAAATLAGWDLPPAWTADPPDNEVQDLLSRRFPGLAGVEVRGVQRAAVKAAQAMTRPGLLIVEAGMGEGKTEAALLAGEILAAKFGLGGVVFALPTQATSDGIFPRLRDWVGTLGTPRTSIFLAHGKAALNEDYRILAHAGRIAGVGDPEDIGDQVAVVTSWLRGRRRGMLANFVAGTIDQVLFAALKARFVPLRHLALAGKVVVVDEVHAADTFMQVYLRRALGWLAAHGTPVILLSATLPPQMREALVAAYLGARPAIPNSRAYPRLTTVTDTVDVVEVESDPDRRRQLTVELADEWQEEACRAVTDGACVAVVHNTVGGAQASYHALVSRLGAERVMLVHSRFLATARMDRERQLRHLLGPPDASGHSPQRPTGFVVVGTQVLEQSLDIDVDLMVTDLAPIDLVLQRAGRLHRHRRAPGARPASVSEPRLLVTAVTSLSEQPPELDAGGAAVYGQAALLRALAVLGPHLAGRPVDLPSDVPRLVDAAYSAELQAPPGWQDAWDAAESERRDTTNRLEADASVFLLPDPTDQQSLVGLLRQGSTEPDDDGSGRARARVRDTDETIEVIVVRDDGQLRPMPEAGLPPDTILPTELGPPPDDVARRLATCTLRLPGAMTKIWGDSQGYAAIDRVIDDLERQGSHLTGWAQSPWLKGELVLVLDARNEAVIDRWRLTYDPNSGLRYTKERLG